MAAFYRGEYDLYAEIHRDPPAWLAKVAAALAAAGREDRENDAKDAAQEIVALGSYEAARQQLSGLMAILSEAIGVEPEVQRS